MGRRITIEPVTRIEGHARVTISLGEDGRVADARVHVAQLRGFEAICVGRLVGELPALTSRICGICPMSHAVASASAGDAVLGVEPPPAARRLRALVLLAERVQSHALSFHFLSAPDLVLPPGGDPARRSFLGLAEAAPALARDGLALRRFGRDVIEQVAGRRTHAAFAVPGGVTRPLERSTRETILAALPGALSSARRTLDLGWERLAALARETSPAGDLETLFLAMVSDRGEVEPCEGRLRVVGPRGEVLADGLDPARYQDLVEERAEPWTYAKLARLRLPDRPPATYRVGPLARLAVATAFGTPLADAALCRFRSLEHGPVRAMGHAHLARLVELVAALERMEALLADPEILDPCVLGTPGAARGEGVGACEAPRGTLLHHYRADPAGLVTHVNLVVPTGQNGLAMNLAVRRIAERWCEGGRLTETLVERVGVVIRAFDPCLSCAAHAEGVPPVALRLQGPAGEVLDEWPPGAAPVIGTG